MIKKDINSLEQLYKQMTTLEKEQYKDDLFLLHKNRGIKDLDSLVDELNTTQRRFKVDANLRLFKHRKIKSISEIKITNLSKEKKLFCKKYNITSKEWNQRAKDYEEQLKTYLMDNINNLLFIKSETLWNKSQEIKIKEHQSAEIINNTAQKSEHLNNWKKDQAKLTYNDDITSKAELFANMYEDHYLIFMTATLTDKENIYTNLADTHSNIEKQIQQQHKQFIDFNKTIGYSLNEKNIERKNIFTKELTKSLNIHLHYFEAVKKDDLEKWLNTIVSARKKVSAIGRIELKVIYSQRDIIGSVKTFKIKTENVKLRILHNSKKSKLVKDGRLEGIWKITNTELEKGNHISIKVSKRDFKLEEQIKEDNIIRNFLNNKISNENLLLPNDPKVLAKDSIVKQLKYILKYATKTIEIDKHANNKDEFFNALSLEKLLLKHNYSDNENSKLFNMSISEYQYTKVKSIIVRLFEEQYYNKRVTQRTIFYDFCEYLKSIDIQPILETLELKEQLQIYGIDKITTKQLQIYFKKFNHSSTEFINYAIDELENSNKNISDTKAKELLLKTLQNIDEQIFVKGTNETIHTPLLIEQKNNNLLVNMKTYKELAQYKTFIANYQPLELDTSFYDLMATKYLSSYNNNKQHFYAKKFYISQLINDGVVVVYEDRVEIQNTIYDFEIKKSESKKLKTFSERDRYILSQNTFTESIDDFTSRIKHFEYEELGKLSNKSLLEYNKGKKQLKSTIDELNSKRVEQYINRSERIKQQLQTKPIKQITPSKLKKRNTTIKSLPLKNLLNIYDEIDFEKINQFQGDEQIANLIYNCLIGAYHNYKMNYLPPEHLKIFSNGILTKTLLSNTPKLKGIEEEDGKYFLKAFNYIEEQIAKNINNRKNIPQTIFFTKDDLIIDKNISLSKEQTDAVLKCCNSNISILTGGGGTGKTTVSKTICHTLLNKGLSIKLVSPTGAAATRMSKVIGVPANTIHSSFKININSKSNTKKLEKFDVLLIDEASMLDEKIAYNIFKILPLPTKIIFIGDIQQLPPVGHGRIFENLYNSNKIPTAKLTKTFRQFSESEILTLVEKLKNGNSNFKYNQYDNSRELNLINIKNNTQTIINLKGDEEKVINTKVINNICDIAIAKYFNVKESFQILVYDNKTRELINEKIKLQNRELNISKEYQYKKKSYDFALYDKVIYKNNNHKKKIMNGFTGYIVELGEKNILVKWDNGFYEYVEQNEFKDLDYAFAITIHGSQGNEYKEVFLVIIKSILDKNILYTAITRAKEKLSVFTNNFLFKKSFTVSSQLIEYKNEIYEIQPSSRLDNLLI
jgi:hypothetical protein